MQEFPMAELSITTIRARWGPGTYRVMFIEVARGTRQMVGNGKIFDLPDTVEPRVTPPSNPVITDAAEANQPEDQGYMVRALLRAAEGKHQPEELFDALAIPVGMALSSLFALQDRNREQLEAVERRLALLEERLGPPRPVEPETAPILERILGKLEAMEQKLPSTGRHDSPSGGRRRKSPSG